MSENPLKPLISTVASISRSLQTHLSRFLIAPDCTTDDLTIYSLTTNPLRPFSSFSLGAETTVAAPPIKVLSSLHLRCKKKKNLSVWASGCLCVWVNAQEKEVKPLTKEELGKATWTLLHTIAAQVFDIMPIWLFFFSLLYFIGSHYLLTRTFFLH